MTGRWAVLMAATAVLLTAACSQNGSSDPEKRAEAGLAHLERGYLYLERGNFDRAMEDLVVAAELMPDSTAPLLAIAGVYEAEGKFQQAVETYRAAIALEPDLAAAHFKIALISKRARKDYETALPRLQRAAELDSTEAEYFYQLGDTYHDLERFGEAKENFEMAISLDPDHPYAHYGLGEILEAHMDRPEEGFSEYEKAVAISPNDPALRLLIGEAYAKHRRAQEAYTHLNAFLRLAPEAPQAEMIRKLLNRLGRSEG